MKTHLTEEEVFDMAYDKFGMSNINVDKLLEIGVLLDLEYDDEKESYHNPNCCNCEKKLDKIDLEFGKKSHPYLCASCYTSNG